jgi:enamine deaminase RidA (YjgF/YER057c/UK114 family)
MRILQPKNWKPAVGYANGIEVPAGRIIFVAGQIGWNSDEKLVSNDLVEQFGQALDNILEVLANAGGTAEHICRISGFCTAKEEYIAGRRALGPVWRTRMGRHFPTMSLIFVDALLEDGAKIELEATAVLPEE